MLLPTYPLECHAPAFSVWHLPCHHPSPNFNVTLPEASGRSHHCGHLSPAESHQVVTAVSPLTPSFSTSLGAPQGQGPSVSDSPVSSVLLLHPGHRRGWTDADCGLTHHTTHGCLWGVHRALSFPRSFRYLSHFSGHPGGTHRCAHFTGEEKDPIVEVGAWMRSEPRRLAVVQFPVLSSFFCDLFGSRLSPSAGDVWLSHTPPWPSLGSSRGVG